MLLFLMGILFDETLRRLVIPWIRRHPEHVPMMRGLLAGAFEPASRDGMYYMSGGSFLDTMHAAAQAEADRQAQEAAKGLVRSFVEDLTSGLLGPVDERTRTRIGCHVRGQEIREQLAGFGLPHIPGLNMARRLAYDYNPASRLAVWSTKKAVRYLDRPFGSSRPAPARHTTKKRRRFTPAAPQDDGSSAAPADDAPPPPAPDDSAQPDDGSEQQQDDDTQGALMEPSEQMLYDLVDEHGDVPASLLMGVAVRLKTPEERARLWGNIERRRRRHHGHHGHHHGHRGDVTGWGLSSLFHRTTKAASSPAGTLLVSATPGGVSALAAKQIAAKALKTGALKPEHLKAAGDLTRRGRAGDQEALVKIAAVKQAAGRGNKDAEIALDRIKLAHCIQTGGRCAPSSSGRSSFRKTYEAGAQAIALHPIGRHGRAHF